ncbi:isochorismate synthase [Pseudoclavibacter chungangensis]|uniref:isochorismate synthase n=1 Tax=Pseudoclavibacter chungangensis TaxID=587635 RepID=A0A7J5BR14_9MICO|nr:chorismate-binding protein [Pseudoclavibacter chungangensis]KAB1656664.1 isochorismate synthase [Pseudoclavibacter chungangensis]NYJ67885.1 menaquinone-specific isochorismate synthase [Pseudoclavibacter chungangensis]
MSRPDPIRLRARTVEIDDPGALLTRADPASPTVWSRRGEGLVGLGTAWRGESHGPERIATATRAWNALTARAEVDDEAGLIGSGLVALGAIAFSGRSRAPSVLEVPATVVGRRGGRGFLTAVTADGSEPVPQLPQRTATGTDASTAFVDGRMTPDAHRRAVEEAIALIRSGELSKIVLARDLVGRIPVDADRRTAIARLEAAYPECWTFAIDGMTGASPETLVRSLGRQVAARVLAGTSPRGADADEDAHLEHALLDSAKNRREHRYAVDSALASLARLDAQDDPGSGLTSSREPFTLALPNVWHLASDIRGTLPPGLGVLDLVGALHPTAAVGGTPTPLAVDAIDRLEPFDRRRYAGPVGWVGANGDGEWAIALRSAEVRPDGTVTAFAGGGIVGESDASDEYDETELKFRPIVEAFAPR